MYCLAQDRKEKYFVTGADDNLVKIWNSESFILQQTLRGHDQAVTDLYSISLYLSLQSIYLFPLPSLFLMKTCRAIDPSDTLVASSSQDSYVRVYELQTVIIPHFLLSSLTLHSLTTTTKNRENYFL